MNNSYAKEQNIKSILNFIKINDNISTAGQPSKEEFKVISKNKFDIVINLALHDSNNALKNEDKIVSQNNMIYIHIPISWDKPELDRLTLFCTTLKALQQENKRVFIHCAKNYRVAIFIYHYKKTILKDKNARLMLPKEFQPNKTWEEIINIKVNKQQSTNII